jgi:hypothetical protein
LAASKNVSGVISNDYPKYTAYSKFIIWFYTVLFISAKINGLFSFINAKYLVASNVRVLVCKYLTVSLNVSGVSPNILPKKTASSQSRI